MNVPCPQCPDGYVWTSNGPTCKPCPRCKGLAYLGDDTDEESDEDTDEVHDFCKPDAIFGMGN